MSSRDHSRRRWRVVLAGTVLLLAAAAVAWRLRSGAGVSTFLAPDSVGMALCLYKLDVGSYPVCLEALVKAPGVKSWNGPYLQTEGIPPDRWGTPLRYLRKARGYELRSAGRDRAFNSPDDEVVLRTE